MKNLCKFAGDVKKEKRKNRALKDLGVLYFISKNFLIS